ncbi:hypothetical protein ACFQ0I_11815 [Mariniflexile aquimaris]|uniref:Uncharacterized protein n=1 Tax=Mariniflexile aquimaris TaxID=881009 RepID=A0ABW3BUN4_9FLAO
MKMLSIILSCILTATILFHSLQVSFTYAYYYLDKSDFIERLCENKEKPEMQCEGKCHLMKVAESNTNDDKEPFKAMNLKEITLFIVEQSSFEFVNNASKITLINHYSNLYCNSISRALDHPPQV